jgi:hypothetical protein
MSESPERAAAEMIEHCRRVVFQFKGQLSLGESTALIIEYDRRGERIAELERDLADAQAILRAMNRKLAGGR